MLGALLSLGATACQTVAGDDALAARGRILNARKAASLEPWKHRVIQHRPATRYAGEAAVWLLPAAARSALREGRVAGGGTAVALTPDGYYLTAAHNIGKAPLLLARPGRDGWQTGSVRVVWTGRSMQNGPDLALLKSPLPPARGTTPAHWADLAAACSRPVLAAGWGTQPRGATAPAPAAGHLRDVLDRPSGPFRPSSPSPSWRLFTHTAPLARGDSGAPLFNERGELLGLHTGGEFDRVTRAFGREFLHDWISTAVAPDPAWLQSLIDVDRARP